MLRLIVMRHAKSSWDNASLPDHDRPLNDRGRQEAPLVGARLVELDWQPELVLSSDSRRTRETFECLLESFPGTVESEFRRDLYQAGVDSVISAVASQSSDVETMMVLGHNPGWEHLVQYLCGDAVTMKTSTAALLRIDRANWNEALRDRGAWELADVIYPREL